ncbi:hypothetical protein [Streptomyces sp. NPDC004658]
MTTALFRYEAVAVCPQMDTHIQIGPTGKKLLPLTVKNAGPAPAASGHSH